MFAEIALARKGMSVVGLDFAGVFAAELTD